MALFYYRYITSKGKKKSGLIDAEGMIEAKEKLRTQKILVTSIKEKELVGASWQFRRQSALTGKHLINFTHQLASLLNAGMPLYESLICLEEQYRSESFHSVLLSLCEQIKKGSSLSEAMEQFPENFTPLYRSMVEAGESVGNLEKSLEKLGDLLNKQSKLKKQLTTAMIYPALLFSFSLLVCTLLLTFVIPSLATLFEDHTVNRFTSLVIGMSHFLTHGWSFYLPFLALLITGGIYLLTSSKGKRWLQWVWIHLPLLKTLVIQASMARFSRTMGTLLEGGVTIIRALQISRNTIRNPFLEQVIEQAEGKIVEGSLLSIELKKSPLIPPLIPRLLAIGEEGGGAPTGFHKIADLYEEEVDKTLAQVTALAQPVILVIMGGIVGLIMLAVLLPLTDINAFL